MRNIARGYNPDETLFAPPMSQSVILTFFPASIAFGPDELAWDRSRRIVIDGQVPRRRVRKLGAGIDDEDLLAGNGMKEPSFARDKESRADESLCKTWK